MTKEDFIQECKDKQLFTGLGCSLGEINLQVKRMLHQNSPT